MSFLMRCPQFVRAVHLAAIGAAHNHRLHVVKLALRQRRGVSTKTTLVCSRAGRARTFNRICFQYSMRESPSPAVSSSIISSYTQLHPLQLSELPVRRGRQLSAPARLHRCSRSRTLHSRLGARRARHHDPAVDKGLLCALRAKGLAVAYAPESRG